MVDELNSFREWLSAKTSLTQKSRLDVISRLNRVISLTGATSPDDVARRSFDINASIGPEIVSSNFVRAQLRRSVQLYRDFKADK